MWRFHQFDKVLPNPGQKHSISVKVSHRRLPLRYDKSHQGPARRLKSALKAAEAIKVDESEPVDHLVRTKECSGLDSNAALEYGEDREEKITASKHFIGNQLIEHACVPCE